jgi:RNA polymerase sigma-70 factor (ECF subfamily)
VRGYQTRRDRKPDHPAPLEEPAAFERLVEEHQKGIYALAYRITGDPDTAWDVAQETFLRAYERRGQLWKVSRVRAWLFRIASNLSIDHIRRRVRFTSPEDRFWETQAGADQDPSIPVGEEETMARIRAALLTLTERERDAFLLKHWEGLGIKEVAAALGSREGTVKSTLHRAAKKLQKVLRGKV